MLVVDAKGEEIDRVIGYRPPKKFLAELKPLLQGKSFAAFKKRLEKDPADFEAVVGLARKYQERRGYPEAEKLYNQILKGEKATASMRNQAAGGLAIIAFFKSRGQDLAGLEKYFDKNKETGDVVDHAKHLFGYYQREKKTPKVIEVGDYLLHHGSDSDANFLNNYAWYLALQDTQPKKALKLAKKAVKLSPLAHILDTLAETYARNGRHEKAVATQKKAVEKASDRQRKQLEERLEGFKKALKESQEKKS